MFIVGTITQKIVLYKIMLHRGENKWIYNDYCMIYIIVIQISIKDSVKLPMKKFGQRKRRLRKVEYI